MDRISEIKQSAFEAIARAASREELEDIRIHYLGRKGELTQVLRSLGELSLEERRALGPQAQSLSAELADLINRRSADLSSVAKRPAVDLSAPGQKFERGHVHPLTQVDREIRKIFAGMNFSVVEGPEVESEYYNFDALNIAPDHPARDAWDTFWLREGNEKKEERVDPKKRLLLRTHTSPMQARYLEAHEPPFQIIVPGRCFRYEATDMSHEVNFYQFEGMMVGKNITLANFKFVVEEFFKKLFKGQKIEFRFRPSYFPFTEPSVEVDIKYKGVWLEMMGAGMVHPRVFEYAHYNPRDFQGFAFGCGIDRLAMIKYQIPDVRLFYSGDLRFVRQF